MTYRILTLLDWALIASSFFNTISLLWLGLTVLLNAERRVLGTWVAGGGLIFGGAFFVGHTAVVGRVIGSFTGEMEFYWRVGWMVLVVAPYLWYVVMAWYSGALRQQVSTRFLSSERLRLIILSIVCLLAVVLVFVTDPLPGYDDLRPRVDTPGGILSSVAVLRLINPVFAILCIGGALSVLYAPAASDRFMGNLARGRARPWLIAASLVLLLIALTIGAGALLLIEQLRGGSAPGITVSWITLVIVFDLFVSTLIVAAIFLIGQAIVTYEIFTGAALPRGELARQWRRVLILAGGFGIAVGWSLSGAGIPEHPIYQLLLATILMTVFVALVGWRSARTQATGITRLRPFVASQHLFEQALGPRIPTEDEPAIALHALCVELLGAAQAYLVPLGPMAELAGPPLAVPRKPAAPAQAVAGLAAGLSTPAPLCLAINPETYGGAIWAVPLSSERGLIGMLLLGPKSDGGLYTQEEIELAQDAGERLIDAQATAEIGRRLVTLQRRRLAETQLIDRRTRRVLHDEVLPLVHAAILTLQTSGEQQPAAVDQLIAAHKQISDLLHALPSGPGPDLARLGPLGALRRAITEDMAGAFDEVCWEVSEAAEAAAHTIEPLSAEALYHAAREAARNAARHGRGSDPGRRLDLKLRAEIRTINPGSSQIVLKIEDDGVGITASRSTSEGGHGLALHSTLLAIMGGALSIESGPSGSTRVTLSLPLGSPGA